MRFIYFDTLKIVFVFILAASIFMTGCSEGRNDEAVSAGKPFNATVEPRITIETETDEDLTPKDPEPDDGAVEKIEAKVEDPVSDILPEEEGDDDPGQDLKDTPDNGTDMNAEISEEDHAEEEKPQKASGIVWIGDSLTQGSLGDMDDNLDNAPYVRLGRLCKDRGNIVEGFGYYGFVTSDIFWRYTEFYENGEPKDPEKIYVLWVGSNDFALASDPVSALPEVMGQIDRFLGADLKKYIVLSHLPRAETKPGDIYKSINEGLKAGYGDHFLDITACASVPEGFNQDEVHLTQQSYDNVADAVFDKLIQMGYI